MFMYKRIIAAVVCCLVPIMASAASDAASVTCAKSRLNRVAGHVLSKQLASQGTAATADFVKIHQSVIRQNWSDSLAAFEKNILKSMLENEERYKKDYFVFYHAQKTENRVVTEFLKHLYEHITKKPLRSDFEFLRFWQYGSDFTDVNSYLESFRTSDGGLSMRKPAGGTYQFNDLGEAVSAMLLSVNPFLFGDVNSIPESAFDHFVGGTQGGQYKSGARPLLDRIFNDCSLDPKYIQELLKISAQFQTKTGDIIQLFIPKSLINDHGYLSIQAAVPLYYPLKHRNNDRWTMTMENPPAVFGRELAHDDYDAKLGRYVRADGILDIIQNDIDIIKDVKDIQVRLFFAKSGPLLDPELGAKMFRFTTLSSTPPKRLCDYKKQVADVCRRMFDDYKIRPSRVPQKSLGVFMSSLTAAQEQDVQNTLSVLTSPRTVLEAIRYPNALPLIKQLAREWGDPLNSRDRHRSTPLTIAASMGALDIVQYLLAPGDRIKGANIEAADILGQTALMAAAAQGHLPVVRYLIDQGARMDVMTKNELSLLMLAAVAGKLNVVQYLVDEKHVDMEVAGNSGCTALLVAAIGGHVDVVRFLISRGARLDATDKEGRTILMRAAWVGHLPVVKDLLYTKGVDMHAKSPSGETPLMLAAKGGTLDVVDYLLLRGAQIDAVDNEGCTALMIAVQEGHVEIVRYLVKHGAAINMVVGKGGRTALNDAVSLSYGDLELVRFLVDRGALIDGAKDSAWTPLMAAVYHGWLDVIRYLIDRGARLDTVDKDGQSALFMATRNGRLDIVRCLVEAGARIDLVDNKKKETALDFARGMNHHAIVDYLEGILRELGMVEEVKSKL